MKLTQRDDDAVRMIMKSSDHAARERTRAHCLYLRHRQYTTMEAADILDVTPRTVINIVNNYCEGGMESAIKDDPRPGRIPSFDDRIKSEIVAIVCSNPPEGFDRWTLELLRDAVIANGITPSICKESIRLILQEHDLKPWQHKMWCVGEIDEDYIERMEDVLDVYEEPYNKDNPVVCVDEKPVSLLSDIRDPIPAKPGTVEKVDYEYERHGSVNVFAMVEPKVGLYINKVTEFKKSDDFAEFMSDISDYYGEASCITVVMDNYCTHNKQSLERRFGMEEAEKLWNRFDVHYTPVHASWLNQAEIAIGMYQRQCLGDCRISDIVNLEKKTFAWNRIINNKNVTINWKFNKHQARRKFGYG